MKTEFPKPGSYVVAVSGGVDSVVLLDMLSKQSGLRLTVAHFDHGIREDSSADRRFVEQLARVYRLPFVYDEGRLGAGSSEDEARQARYRFLRNVAMASGAMAIVTAHQQDDVLETAILNMLRGTGRKGLTSLKSQTDIIRPLLKVSKIEILEYAKKNKLQWHEDPTNHDTQYLRNYVRHKLLPKFSEDDRSKFTKTITKLQITNQEVDELLADFLDKQSSNTIDRLWFNQLPHSIAKEMMAAWLRKNELRDFDSKTLERLVTAAKTATAGKSFPVLSGVTLKVYKDSLALEATER